MILDGNIMVLVGNTAPLPLPATTLENLESIEVHVRDHERSGFKMTFRIGRGPIDAIDYPDLLSRRFEPFNRVQIHMILGGLPKSLIDGFITKITVVPTETPGASKLIVTGEDVSVMMSLVRVPREHPALNVYLTVTRILGDYASIPITPLVIPPPADETPVTSDRTGTQQGTDLEHLTTLARRYGYVFYIETHGPGLNFGYWGPPVHSGVHQRALSANRDPLSNIEQIQFTRDGLRLERIEGQVEDRRLNMGIPIQTSASLRAPRARERADLVQRTARVEPPDDTAVSVPDALARAQARTDTSSDAVVTAEGKLNTARYGRILSPRGLVNVIGVGDTNDGCYYVQEVKHVITKENHTQEFTLTREGTGSLTPIVSTQ